MYHKKQKKNWEKNLFRVFNTFTRVTPHPLDYLGLHFSVRENVLKKKKNDSAQHSS